MFKKCTQFLGEFSAELPLKDSMGRGARKSMGRGAKKFDGKGRSGIFGDVVPKNPTTPLPIDFLAPRPIESLSDSSVTNSPKNCVHSLNENLYRNLIAADDGAAELPDELNELARFHREWLLPPKPRCGRAVS